MCAFFNYVWLQLTWIDYCLLLSLITFISVPFNFTGCRPFRHWGLTVAFWPIVQPWWIYVLWWVGECAAWWTRISGEWCSGKKLRGFVQYSDPAKPCSLCWAGYRTASVPSTEHDLAVLYKAAWPITGRPMSLPIRSPSCMSASNNWQSTPKLLQIVACHSLKRTLVCPLCPPIKLI